MSPDDIIRMAREAGVPGPTIYDEETGRDVISPELECFAYSAFAAGAAAERERFKWDGLHSCHSECDRPVCVHTRKAVEAEREECAKFLDDENWTCAAALIRARGKT